MATWTLSDIQRKVRQVTGRYSERELSTSELIDRINKFYQYTFPAEVKLDKKHSFYDILTLPNQAIYEFDNETFTNVEPPASIDYLNLTYYQDPAQFFENNPYKVTRLTPWTGDGATTAFNTSVQAFPILPDTLVITDNLESFEDKNKIWTTSTINIVGSLGGSATINYSTGSVSVTFNTAPINGQDIYLSYSLFQPGRPTAVLFYDNEFTFYPPPDTAYRFAMKAYKRVEPLVNAADTPELPQWGPCIAYGTARDIFSDYGENDAYAETTVLYKEQVAYVLNRTEQNLLNTRAAPFF